MGININVKEYLKNKWTDRVKQFGLSIAFKQVLRAVVRRMYLETEDIILAVLDHKPKEFFKEEILALSASMIDERERRWGLSKEKAESLRSLLTKDCIGYVVEQNGLLAAHAFVQFSGTYHFFRGGKLHIPENTAVLRNLFVFRQFRGSSIGKDLNFKRLSAIPEGFIPLVFVITENRYAIRNIKMYGFTEIIKVRRITWLSRFTKQTTVIIKDIPITHKVISGLYPISDPGKV